MNEGAGGSVRFVEADLYGLVGPDRDAAIDALAGGKEFPFVIVEGTLICSGSIDTVAITKAVERLLGHVEPL